MKIKIEQLNLEEGERKRQEEENDEEEKLAQIMQHMKPMQQNQMVKHLPVVENQLSLGERDNYSSRIEQQIQMKREMLLEKQKTLKRRMQENQYLEGVHSDYIKYYNYIKKQKEDQINHLNLLNQYLNDIIVNGKLTDEDITQSKKEQDEILGTISTIKDELDKIISE